MNDGALKTSMPSVPAVGSFVTVRGKVWIVEGAEQRGPIQALTLISCEDDSQGEAIELAYAVELQPEVLDPNDWSPLLTKTFEGPIDFVLFDIWGDMLGQLIEILAPRLRPGAILCADNTAGGGSYGPMFEFINNPANGLRTMTLPFKGGFELTVKV